MRQLTSLNASFLALESSNQTGHVAGLTILDPPTTKSGDLRFEGICKLMEERLPLLPLLRWRLVEVPFGLDFHVRELALPPGAAREKLAEQVAQVVSRPLDRSRPLWELSDPRLEHGHKALLTKILRLPSRGPGTPPCAESTGAHCRSNRKAAVLAEHGGRW